MDEKSIRIIPFSGKKEKWHIWSGKITARAGMKGYDILLAGDAEIMAENVDEKRDSRLTATLNLLNKTDYNNLIPAQEDTIYFQIIEE